MSYRIAPVNNILILLTPEQPSLPKTMPSTPRRPDDVRILVIADTDRVRRATAHTLRAAGYRVNSILDGHQGLRAWALLAPLTDLVIVDLHKPGMTGLDLVRGLLDVGTFIPILATRPKPPLDLQGIPAYVTWVEAPLTEETLTRKVRALVGN
jgi:CheY-like chemotaxis protein